MIVDHHDWELSERGRKDAQRHREKIDDAIRSGIKDVIAEESIITSKKGKKVRVPVKGLKDYRFVHGNNDGNSGGIGQGEGDEGDIIDSRPRDGDNKPGDQPGEYYLETEVDIDYLIKIMFEDLGLPWIEEKAKANQLVPKGWKFETITKKGIIPRLHKKKTMMEAIKRNVILMAEIMNETECSEDDANKALMQSCGDLNEAILIIQENRLTQEETGFHIEDDDLRFKQIDRDVEIHSNAVVIAMMDTSGSMTRDKKYLARSMLFWMKEFLQKVYDNVQIRFIQHTTDASIVDEETFFHRGESGGTMCHTAFDLANNLIDGEYPTNEWNVYCMYISDGEDFDAIKTIKSIKSMLKKDINMLGYSEIILESMYGGGSLLKEILNNWKFNRNDMENTTFLRNDEDHFLISVIKDKSHIWPSLRHFLFQPAKKG